MSNIDTFNQIVGFVFADLYEAFPVPIALEAFTYAQKAELFKDSSMIDVEDEEPAAAAIQWLLDEGYVRSGSDNYEGAFAPACVLTLAGLRLMSLPQSLEKVESVGDGLLKAAKEGMNEGVKSSVGSLVKIALIEGGKVAFQSAIQGAIQAMK